MGQGNLPTILISNCLLTLPTLKKGGNFMSVNWITDADQALTRAKDENKPLLIDFSAAPA